METHCPQCQFDNPAGMRFCGNCGAPLDGAGKPGSLEIIGQRRNVTVMFVDLSGYTHLSERMDDEDLYELVQQYIEILANDVNKYEGMVDKYTGDGLMAVFGAPVTHENNAELAVRAALEMHQDVAELSKKLRERLHEDLRVHIGLHSGSVVLGGIGSDRLMSYTAIGDTVNLAQRLENTAPAGMTLVSESVYRQTRTLFDFDASPTLHLKGLSQPIQGYQVLGIKSKARQARGIEGLYSPLIGREVELGLLKHRLSELRERQQGGFVLITGEAGIGKTRLISELKVRLQSQNLKVIEGQSLAYRRLVSYWIFLAAVRSFLSVGLDTPSGQQRSILYQRIKEVMGPPGDEVLPYLEHFLSLPVSKPGQAEKMKYLDAGQLRQRIFLAIRDWLCAEAQFQPVLMILEDLHWADEASLHLLQFLVENIQRAPILIIGISRSLQSGNLSKTAEWASQNLGDRFEHINLPGLSTSQSQAMLYELLEYPEISPPFLEEILDRAAGIPFYLEEILRTLIDRGLMKRENGRWKLNPAAAIRSLGVPDSLEGLILARFDRLDEPQRRVLQVASVIGLRFNVSVLRTVLNSFDHDLVSSILAQLGEREFILPQSDSPYTEYTFRHTLMSDAIYKTLLKKEQNQLHGEIGEAIESIYANQLDSQAEILARHFAWSPKKEKALHYLILAGQKAARDYNNDQARQQFEQALEVLEAARATPYQAYQVHSGLGDVLVFIGEYSPAREHFLAAYDLLEQEDPGIFAEERSALQRKAGTTFERQGEYEQALTCLSKAQHELIDSPLPEPVERAQILNDTGWIHHRRGNSEDAQSCLFQALTLIENTKRYDVIASIYNRLGGVYYLKGQLDQASQYVQKSLALREELGDLAAVARSYNNLGLLSWRRGNWEKALDHFQRSFSLHANLGDVEGIIDLHGNLGLLHLDRGDSEAARQHFLESLTKAQLIGHHFIVGMTYNYLSRLCNATEDWNQSLEYGKKSLEVMKGASSPENLADIYTNIGDAWLGLGRLDEALKWAQSALDTVEKAGQMDSGGYGRAARLLGRIYRLCENLERAGDYFKKSQAVFETLGDSLEQGRTLAAEARLALDRKDPTAARVYFKQAWLIFSDLGAKLDLKKIESV